MAFPAAVPARTATLETACKVALAAPQSLLSANCLAGLLGTTATAKRHVMIMDVHNNATPASALLV
jgi:hypothetical protein